MKDNLDIHQKYRVKNLTDSILVTVAPSLNNRRREWLTPGAVSYVTLEEIEDVMQTHGGKTMYMNSLKVYASDDVLQYLGLPTRNELDTSDEALAELFDMEYVEFEKRLQSYPDSVYSRIVNYAIENDISDLNIIDILTENTKINVLREIRNRREEEPKEKTVKKKSTYEKMQEQKSKSETE